LEELKQLSPEEVISLLNTDEFLISNSLGQRSEQETED
jgi:hypothetical protein